MSTPTRKGADKPAGLFGVFLGLSPSTSVKPSCGEGKTEAAKGEEEEEGEKEGARPEGDTPGKPSKRRMLCDSDSDEAEFGSELRVPARVPPATTAADADEEMPAAAPAHASPLPRPEAVGEEDVSVEVAEKEEEDVVVEEEEAAPAPVPAVAYAPVATVAGKKKVSLLPFIVSCIRLFESALCVRATICRCLWRGLLRMRKGSWVRVLPRASVLLPYGIYVGCLCVCVSPAVTDYVWEEQEVEEVVQAPVAVPVAPPVSKPPAPKPQAKPAAPAPAPTEAAKKPTATKRCMCVCVSVTL